MIPENNSTTPAAAVPNQTGFNHWNSPVPYLFSGLALMLGLIAFALMILAFSFRKNTNLNNTDSSSASGNDKPPRSSLPNPEMEPRIVVIMAGDHNPTYIAKPAAPPLRRQTEEV
ncbi:OLC1v1009885C1 [Oldenlandia corymbosa var. corymbosa]|uniref:OLC1v1009885C1 n=1 Tax=Oldenlandia corymbosa var. corymbosa TaxID=529605 RepID=A0AAV1DPY1_OLDCO|nr:OLC1v1009885C1 [Oldenlandia corymbosa var. corymbosa]